jgi:hypothetical protein
MMTAPKLESANRRKEKQWYTQQTLHRKRQIEQHESHLMKNRVKEATAKIDVMRFEFSVITPQSIVYFMYILHFFFVVYTL